MVLERDGLGHGRRGATDGAAMLRGRAGGLKAGPAATRPRDARRPPVARGWRRT
ncbi:hypothetical protein AWT69_002223 [Pseudomonas putida]|nr:hypothetical protein AWT69_002223 [Pseudomonas putida]